MDEEEPSCRLNKLDVYLRLGNLEDTNLKNIPSDMGKVRDEWIADLLVVHGGLESGLISKIERERDGTKSYRILGPHKGLSYEK